MGVWEKLKSWLGFGAEKVEALPPAQNERKTTSIQTVKLTRADGSFVVIRPNLDRTNTQALKQIVKSNGETVYIPSYSIEADEIAEFMPRGSTIANIYMDIDYQRLLREPDYKRYVEDIFLSSASLKVGLESGGYIGKIMEDNKGLFTYSDPDITKGALNERVHNSIVARDSQTRSADQVANEQRARAMRKKTIPSTGPHTGPLIDDYEP